MIETYDEILTACKAGDNKARMTLYKLFYKLVYNCCFRILLQAEEAEDAMQETFLKAFDKIDLLRDGRVEAWLKRIAVNTSIDKVKKRRLIQVELDDRLPVPDEDEYDEEKMILKVDRVKAVIAKLPDIHRIILNLHLIDGFDYEEIAVILNIRMDAARVNFLRARKKLAEILKNDKMFNE